MKKFLGKLKKVSSLRVAFVLFIALEISFSIVSGVFARYQSSETYLGVTPVSVWDFNLKVNGYETTDSTKKVDLTEGKDSTDTVVSNLDTNTLIGSGIAAGSAGYMSVQLDGTDTQVSSLVTVKATFLNLPTGFRFTDNLGRSLTKTTGISDFVPCDATAAANYNQGSNTYTGTATSISYSYYFSYEEIATWKTAYSTNNTITDPYIELGFRWFWMDDDETYTQSGIYCEVEVGCDQILGQVEVPETATTVHFVSSASDLIKNDDNTLNIAVKDLGTAVTIDSITDNFYLDVNGLTNGDDTYTVVVADDSTKNIVLGTFRRESDYSDDSDDKATVTVNASGNFSTANCYLSDDFTYTYNNIKAYNFVAEHLTDDLNANLIGQSKKNTAYEALTAVYNALDTDTKDDFGITSADTLAQKIASAETDNDLILWDTASGLFVYIEDNAYKPLKTTYSVGSVGADYSLFRFYSAMPSTQTYSIYLAGEVTGTIDNLTTGLDVGSNTGITAITYDRSSATTAQSVIIRTNSANTSITVNAPLDTVKHYGTSGSVNIIAVAGSSYHEFGTVAFMEVSKGRVALEETSDIEQIHINKKTITVSSNVVTAKEDSVFDNIVIDISNVATTPTISRDSIDEISSSGTLVLTVQTATDTEKVYLFQQGIYEQIKVQKVETGTDNEKVWVDTSDADEEVKEVASDIANNISGTKNTDYTITSDTRVLTITNPVNAVVSENGLTEQDKTDTLNASYNKIIRVNQNGQDEYTYITLDEFRNNVNNGTSSYAGYTVTLLKDIDYESETWAPIGSTTYPFSGIFDGGNHTISNYRIVNSSSNQGLFGYVQGVANTNYNVTSIWDNDNKVFSETSIAEGNYTAVLKNLKLSNVYVDISTSGATGGLAGKVINTYIYNVETISGTVKGYKQVGGVVGYMDASIIKQCSNTSSLTVSLNDTCEYTVGGIVGTTRTQNCAVLSCTNNATVNGGNGSTCIAGVVGQMLGSSTSILYGCVNNGNIITSSSTIATSESSYCIGGVAGVCTSALYVVNCTNTGTVQNTAGTCGQISGIGCYRGGVFYNCSNSGTLTGNALYVSGISGGHAGNTNVTTVDTCSNTGTLTNANNNRIATYIGTSATVILKNMALSNANALNQAVYSLTGANLLELDNITFTDNSTAWTYSVVNSLHVKINDTCSVKPTINIGNVNNTIGLEGNNLQITIQESSTITELILKGNNITFTNNGTITAGLVFGKDSQNETVTNLGTIGTVTINGSSNTFNNGDNNHTSASVNTQLSCTGQNMIINNYGIIGENATESGYNVISFTSSSGSTVNNYGIIYGRGNNANYAIGMKDSSTITFNLYSGSKLIKREGGWLISSGSTDMTLVLNWYSGTIYTEVGGTALDETAVSSIGSVQEANTAAVLTVEQHLQE